MTTVPRFDTQEVFNQSPPYENIDLYSSDVPLMEAVKANGAGSRGVVAVGPRAAVGHRGDVFAGASRQ